MQIGIKSYEKGTGKGKDKESLFNVTYYFNSLGTLRHNKYPFTDTYLNLSF